MYQATIHQSLLYFVQDYESWFPLPESYKYAAMLSYFALPSRNFTSMYIQSMDRQHASKKLHNIGNKHIDVETGPYFNLRIRHVDTHPISINGVISDHFTAQEDLSNSTFIGSNFKHCSRWRDDSSTYPKARTRNVNKYVKTFC